MKIDFENLAGDAAYFLLTQTVIPRPIAWVLTANASGSLNLAPFSFFNVLCAEPPLLVVSVGVRDDGSRKDTWENIRRDRHFVVHIPSVHHLDALNASSASLPPGTSEVEALGLATTPLPDFPLPRLSDVSIAFGCKLHEIQEVGTSPQGLIFGRIATAWIDDGVMQHEDGRLAVDAQAVSPLMRLGASQYGSLGQILVKKRPR